MTNTQDKPASEPKPQALEDATCLHCGYPLRGLPSPVCPECGQKFDPHNPTQFLGKVNPLAKRPFLGTPGPPGRWHRRIIIALTVILLLDASSPGFFFLAVCFYLPALLVALPVIFIEYGVRMVVCIYLRLRERAGGKSANLKQGRRWHWVVTPFCFLLMASVEVYPWPMRLRLELSRSALERVVADGRTTSSQRVGLFFVESIRHYNDGSVYFLTCTDFFDEYGIMYDPNPPKIGIPHDVERLAPSWYMVAYYD